MKNEFKLEVYHPDMNKTFIFNDYKELKKWRDGDGYRYDKNVGGDCVYTYLNEYTKNKVKIGDKRQDRYWQNKKIENQRSKIWREQQKLNKLLEVK